jgi:hypothetical protein
LTGSAERRPVAVGGFREADRRHRCRRGGQDRLAREFGRALDLPVVPLDLHYYGPGWQPLPLAEWVDRQPQLAAAEHWVMDGNYASTLALRLERADMVVLDLPPLLCAWRILRRWAVGHLRPAADLPLGLRPTVAPQFLAYVLMFRHRRRAALLAQLAAWDRGGTVVLLSSRRAVRRFLSSLLDFRNART